MLSYIKLVYYLFRPRTVFIIKRSVALGDDLLMSLVLPYIRKKYAGYKIIIEANWVELFKNNPYVDWVTNKHLKTTKRHIKPRYFIDTSASQSIYEQFMQSVGSSGKARPELYFSDDEIEYVRRRFDFPYISICPLGKQKFSANRKEWGVENFQKLRNLFPDYEFVQIGLESDDLLENVHDARGLPVRQSAAVIRNSLFFIGLEGGLMHVAAAAGRRSAIIYGGFIDPDISGYEENLNIVNRVECSPCFRSYKKLEHCETMICMKGISPESAAGKIKDKFKSELSLVKAGTLT
ncbi:MAG: glycosyltransferase family 9 protein [Calditrichaceae bacterium]